MSSVRVSFITVAGEGLAQLVPPPLTACDALEEPPQPASTAAAASAAAATSTFWFMSPPPRSGLPPVAQKYRPKRRAPRASTARTVSRYIAPMAAQDRTRSRGSHHENLLEIGREQWRERT